MKLAIIYHQFIRAGGLENYLIEFCKRLHAAGHELHIVTSRIAPDVHEQLPAHWHTLPRATTAYRRLRNFDRDAMALKLDVQARIGFGRTTLHDLHRAGGGCHAHYSALLPWWKRWAPKNRLELRLERQLYDTPGTQRFVMNSAEVVKQIESRYPAARGRCQVIHTAVDTTNFRPHDDRPTHRATVCKQLGIDPAQRLGLFVSLSHRRKGLDALLRAWRGLDATLLIAGKPLARHYRALLHDLDLTDRVKVLPMTTNIAGLYQCADWFVHPTQYDACANTVLQSMACELPGLISVHDGAIDHLRDGDNGCLLHDPANPAALHTALEQAFARPEAERIAMGQRARQSMLPLTWDAHVAKWLPLLAEV
jgi:UDP-glucose:(heptosyl)LPS alpha-1,3-glucosyltransferase